MTSLTERAEPVQNLFGTPVQGEAFVGVGDAEGAGRAVLEKIAEKICRTRRPGVISDIPAGATYLAQFVAHDLDCACRDGAPRRSRLELGLVYGDGPRHDAFCYQVPAVAGAARHLLRIGRARRTASAPACGALRDLPRVSCPQFDGRAAEARTEVLVPNALSDSNLLLGQFQVLWALLHNAVAARLAETRRTEEAFDLAQRITRGIYRDVIRHDLLATWLMPRFRDRYTTDVPRRLSAESYRSPKEFMAGVGRIGHGLVREIYALNDTIEVAGLRSLVRHTSSGRPHEMPLTEDWLVDFSKFFAVGSSVPQRARAIGPHVARPVAGPLGVGTDDSADGLVLRDLIACSRGGLRSVRSLIFRAARAEPRLFEGCLAQDETRWRDTVAAWLADTGLAQEEIDRLAGDPPLTLFLMLEAEADTGGRSLGGLGSVLMGETLTAALPDADTDPVLDAARAAVFGDFVTESMSAMIRFLQRHYRFSGRARLHSSEEEAPATEPATRNPVGGTIMLDVFTVSKQPISRIEVADHIEMGRVAAQWASDPASRPKSVAELRAQLDGIAVVPDRIKSVEFAQGSLDRLVVQLPAKEMLEESLERMTDPFASHYPLPQFYADHFRPGFGPVMTPLDTLLARVGDYAIAQCR